MHAGGVVTLTSSTQGAICPREEVILTVVRMLAIDYSGNESKAILSIIQWYLITLGNAPLLSLPPTSTHLYTLMYTCTCDAFPAWYCVDMQVE